MATDEHLGDQELPSGEVAWAGLPINLDFAFSPLQRDKVYVQHLTRKRWCSLRSHARDSDVDAHYDPLDAEAG
ncbi:hypothetical protein BN1232_03734 [Mycobacterium lentiflavum]|uniref:Uncharacterized protein n=1 Tax=Mycobacterium lentiflavum TaxID=141349 RepID=A0A0E4GYV1_MYCLN|nr:hypothetical protein [Mycobacterium lentiflavum]CQD17055.1 hypothetical protein BN1232_03734 [Mycobacterium lentiflavum]